MHPFTVLHAADGRSVRARSAPQGCTVITVQTIAGRPDATSTPGHVAHQDAVADVLARAVRSTDTVSELADGSHACLLAGALRRERLSLLAWKLLDALARLPHSPDPAEAPLAGPWRPCIGICVGPGHRQSYQAMAGKARMAMHLAGSRQSGFAFFDGLADGPPTD